MSSNGTKPEYIVKVGLKGTKFHRKVGAAWRIQGGKGLSVKLDPGIALVSAHDIIISIWKNEEKPQRDEYGE